MAQVIRGTDLMLFVKGTGSTYESIAFATSCQLSVNATTLETSSKDSGKWTSKQASKLNWTVTTDNLYSTLEFSKLLIKMIARQELDAHFTVATNADSDSGMPSGGWTPATYGQKGKVVITSLTANAPDNENATFSVTLEGTGQLADIAPTQNSEIE
jgi:TP901-1 family phage major tail protein